MAVTEVNLDLQSDKVMTTARLQTSVELQDSAATQKLVLDWAEPVGADRIVSFPDPGANDDVVYANLAQALTNKTVPLTPTLAAEIASKDYVDVQVAGGTPDATSGAGGATKGKLTMDEDKGLLIGAGIAEIKVDGVTISFNGSGQLQGSATIPDATSGAGGATIGKVTMDEDKGLLIGGGAVAEVKVDGVTVDFNLSGQLEVLVGGGGPQTGTVSNTIEFTEDIGGVTPPANGLISGNDISTLDFGPATDTGTRFAFSVPEDYASGDLFIFSLHQMSSASGSNTIRIETQAKIVDHSAGSIDVASYPATESDLTVLATTDVERLTVLTISDGDFNRGDVIQVLFTRLGTHVNDVHPGDLQEITFQWAYTAIVDSRTATQQSKFFENAAGETATTPNTISGGDISVEDFLAGVDNGLKFDFIVPDNWDGLSDGEIQLVYSMSTAQAGATVRLEPRAKVARVGGTIDTIAPVTFDFGPSNDTDPHRTSSIISLPATGLTAGDSITLILVRRGANVADDHLGDFQLICATATFAVLPATGTATITIQDQFLNAGVFGNPTGVVTGDTDYPDLGGDFEAWDNLSSTSVAGHLDVAYEGRLGSGQTTVQSIKFNIKGTGASPTYTLKLYAEGTGLVHTDGPNPAPVGTTLITKTAVDWSSQPTGQGRFYVVVECDIDVGEAVLVSRHFRMAE